jgi:hypothetical protein
MFVRVLRTKTGKEEADFSDASRPIRFSPIFILKCKQLVRALSSPDHFIQFTFLLENGRKTKYILYVLRGKEKDYVNVVSWPLTEAFMQFVKTGFVLS